jgi:CheY-like chemotaxis protein
VLPLKRISVLVVDDEPAVRVTSVEILEALGYEVFEAANGGDALAVLSACIEITVLVTDVQMPGMTGLELAESARRLRPGLKVILTSGCVSRVDGLDLSILPKPWRATEIAMLIETAGMVATSGGGRGR